MSCADLSENLVVRRNNLCQLLEGQMFPVLIRCRIAHSHQDVIELRKTMKPRERRRENVRTTHDTTRRTNDATHAPRGCCESQARQ